MKKKSIFLVALSIILLIAATANSTLAYFTSYITAEGGYTLNLQKGRVTVLTDVDGGCHWVQLVNSEGNLPIYVRGRFIVPDGCTLEMGGQGWTEGDGYWSYTSILNPGEETTQLQATVTRLAGYDPDSYDIVFIYETSPVLRDQNGNYYSDYALNVVGD